MILLLTTSHFWMFVYNNMWYTICAVLGVYGFFCLFCQLIALPPFFLFWIIPKIERRYGAKLIFNFYGRIAFQNWILPAQEISLYIFFQYFGWNWLNNNQRFALKKIDYKIATTSKAELVMSFLYVFIIVSMIISMAISITTWPKTIVMP